MSEPNASEREARQAGSISTQGEAESPLKEPHSAQEVANTIERFHGLFQSGALTEEEFCSAKARLLNFEGPSFDGASSRVSNGVERPHRRRGRNRDSRDSRSSGASTKHGERGKSDTSSSSSDSVSSSSSSSKSIDFMIAPRAKVWHLLTSESDTDNTTGTAGCATGVEASFGPFFLAMDEGEHSQAFGSSPALDTMRSSSPNAQQRRYGTFQSQWKMQRMSVGGPRERLRVPLRSSQEVRVEYFNCLGASGDRFADVQLRENEMRSPYFLRKRTARRRGFTGVRRAQSETDFAGTTGGESTASSTSTHSDLEMCLNWYWIDMVGRDASQRKYKSALRFLTRRFNICESFLTDRDHGIVMPQICASPKVPTQFLICLRVATPQIALDSDSVLELTNRWIIVVDLSQKLVITIHRMDCACLANMRHQWCSVMKGSKISFQEFLFKLLHDAVNTYESSLEVHANLLDLCESKLFFSGYAGMRTGGGRSEQHRQGQLSDGKVLSHFSDSSLSPFLLHLLDRKSTKPVDKSVMNMFLYHLHRRTNVQYRTLSITQTVLAESFTKLRLCSKEHANQMCVHCIELIDRALEVGDEAKTLLKLHISLQSFRSNELMAVLTKFSAFFTPCSFLAAVYGMNFSTIPEFKWEYGYYFFWIACMGMCLLIYVYLGNRGLLR